MPSSQPRIRRIRAGNASPLTFTGTNSYILGSGRVALIDPGPDDPTHLAALLAALDQGEEVSHIFVTHPHRDHSALAPRLSQATGAPVLAIGRAEDGRSATMQALAAAGLRAAGGDGLDTAFSPDRRVHHGERITGEDWEITVHHTPGHLGSHACFAVGSTLFSGDHVMGWSTSVVMPPDGDMGDYRSALRALSAQDWRKFLPGHGENVTDPTARLAELIAHREGRDVQILAALTDGPATVPDLTARLYSGLDPRLQPAARQNVLAHLIDLAARGVVTSPTPVGPSAPFRLA